MTVIVKHNKTNSITDWTQAQLDEQIALGNFAPGTTLANIVLPSDWNNDHTLTGVGTMAEQNANSVAITGGSINGTTIGATTASTGRFSDLTDTGLTSGRVTYATTGGNLTDSANLTFNGTTFTSTQQTNLATSSGNVQVGSTTATEKLDVSGGGLLIRGTTNQTASNGGLYLGTSGSNSTLTAINPSVQWFNMNFAANQFSFLPQNAEQFRITHTASAVNYVQVTGGTTGNSPVISAQGSDAAVALSITSKSTNAIRFLSNNATNLQFRIVGTNTAVNNLAVTGTIATNAPSLSSEGSDSNISMAFQPKGTGAIDLAAGSSGVNISNGGTVTVITRTASGSGYTSIPSVAVSAPTTAGGVTATASFLIFTNAVSINSGGTGYTVGNVLTVVGGTAQTTAAQITVTSVSAGVITGATISGVNYSVMPPVPASVTGGSGSGATFTVSGVIQASATIINAGSGYIEQPTVTFSGGGGSGAAAYAIVGSGTIIRSLANTLDIHTPAGSGFQVNNVSGSTLIYSKGVTGYGGFLASSITGNSAFYFGYVNNAEVGRISMTSSNNLSFGTSSAASEQLRVSHTASAVNYVQVTGGATGGQPSITAQGSDTDINMNFSSKNAAALIFNTNGRENFRVANGGTSIVNNIQAVGGNAGFSPAFQCRGSDTDIDLTLTPKGAGVVTFGTYTGTILTPTGFITIKDSGGTTRRLLVG
jgi:hypothetical protein